MENVASYHRFLARRQQVEAESQDVGSLVGLDGLHLDETVVNFSKSHDVSPSANEFVLFHGTSSATAEVIAEEGFDFRVARSSGYYGKGVYFASQSCKSHQYGQCNTGGLHTMLICRVVVGNPHYTKCVDRNLARPPPIANSSRYHHSVIARPGPMQGHHKGEQTHTEFVVFDSAQAYPMYIVEYAT